MQGALTKPYFNTLVAYRSQDVEAYKKTGKIRWRMQVGEETRYEGIFKQGTPIETIHAGKLKYLVDKKSGKYLITKDGNSFFIAGVPPEFLPLTTKRFPASENVVVLRPYELSDSNSVSVTRYGWLTWLSLAANVAFLFWLTGNNKTKRRRKSRKRVR